MSTNNSRILMFRSELETLRKELDSATSAKISNDQDLEDGKKKIREQKEKQAAAAVLLEAAREEVSFSHLLS